MEGFMRSSSYFKAISFILICLLSSSGCTVMMAASGKSGDDLSSVSFGTNRKDVEDVLGSPDKICPDRTSNDEQIIWYFFDEGISSQQRAIDVSGAIAGDLQTFGLNELLFPIYLPLYIFSGPHGLMKVTYDNNDAVVNYKKYGYCELQASYGPKGYKPGVMDCQEDQQSGEEIKETPKEEASEKVEDELDSEPAEEDCDPGMESCD
jgi:hypothetical protein